MPAWTSTTFDSASNPVIPFSPHTSRTTPPKTGSAAPVTLERPADGVTGMPAAWQIRSTAATWSASAASTITASGVAGRPSVSPIIEPAHQSRVRVTTSSRSTCTACAASRSASTTASGTSTGSFWSAASPSPMGVFCAHLAKLGAPTV